MNVYSSPSSIIEYEPPKSLLLTTWLKDSILLTEEEVKNEITNVLTFAREFNVKKIIVDARDYPFRENYNIQYWINYTFMPMVVECGVAKYALIVIDRVEDQYESFKDVDSENMQVEYFTNPEEAEQWIES